MKSCVVLRAAAHGAGLGFGWRGRAATVVSQHGQCSVDGLAFVQEEADGLLAQFFRLFQYFAHKSVALQGEGS